VAAEKLNTSNKYDLFRELHFRHFTLWVDLNYYSDQDGDYLQILHGTETCYFQICITHITQHYAIYRTTFVGCFVAKLC
jgi:hypothetical protein